MLANLAVARTTVMANACAKILAVFGLSANFLNCQYFARQNYGHNSNDRQYLH